MVKLTTNFADLMRESRLTFTQKHVFETILRKGQSLPEHPSQMMHSKMRQAYNQQRHKNKASLMGIPVMEDEIKRRPGFRNHVLAFFRNVFYCKISLIQFRFESFSVV